HSYSDKQRCTTIEVGKLIVHPKQTRNRRKYGNDCQENRTGKRDFGNYPINEVVSRLPRLYAWNKPTVFLHVFRHLLGVNHNSGIEKCKGYNQDCKNHVVSNRCIVAQRG